MNDRPIDLDAVRAFIRIAETGSFTRAAEASGTTQSAISLKLKRLEARLGQRLIERSPRHVSLSAQGQVFLDRARALMHAHEAALNSLTDTTLQRISVGISDHVAGPELPHLIARMNARDPQLVIDLRIGSSGDLLKRFDRREIDTILVRQHLGRDDGEVLGREKFGWFAAQGWAPRPNQPLPLATMPEPCGVRSLACDALDGAGIPWHEVFIGGGVAAVSAAVMAGIGIAALAPRMLPLGAVDVGPRLGLPPLPALPILIHSRETGPRPRAAITALSAAFRSVTQI